MAGIDWGGTGRWEGDRTCRPRFPFHQLGRRSKAGKRLEEDTQTGESFVSFFLVGDNECVWRPMESILWKGKMNCARERWVSQQEEGPCVLMQLEPWNFPNSPQLTPGPEWASSLGPLSRAWTAPTNVCTPRSERWASGSHLWAMWTAWMCRVDMNTASMKPPTVGMETGSVRGRGWPGPVLFIPHPHISACHAKKFENSKQNPTF